MIARSIHFPSAERSTGLRAGGWRSGEVAGIRGAKTVGLDIDRGSIKAVQISGAGGGYTLQHVGYHRLPPGTILDGEVADHDLLAAEIREFWDSHSFNGKAVTLGVSNQKVVVRLLDFPHMAQADLQGAISFEAQDHIPMPLDEAVLDYVVLGPREERSDLDRVLVVAAQREMISRYTSAVRTGGLRPAGVDVKALSLTRSTLPIPFSAMKEPYSSSTSGRRSPTSWWRIGVIPSLPALCPSAWSTSWPL